MPVAKHAYSDKLIWCVHNWPKELWHCMAWDVLLQVLQHIFWCTFYGLKIILLASSSVCKIAWELQINFCDLSNKDYSTSAQVLEYYWQIKQNSTSLLFMNNTPPTHVLVWTVLRIHGDGGVVNMRCYSFDFVPFGHDNNQVLYIHVKRSLIYMHE